MREMYPSQMNTGQRQQKLSLLPTFGEQAPLQQLPNFATQALPPPDETQSFPSTSNTSTNSQQSRNQRGPFAAP